MKKEYIIPELLVVKVKTESLLTTISRGADVDSLDEVDSRRDSFWGDDEEDNEGVDAW